MFSVREHERRQEMTKTTSGVKTLLQEGVRLVEKQAEQRDEKFHQWKQELESAYNASGVPALERLAKIEEGPLFEGARSLHADRRWATGSLQAGKPARLIQNLQDIVERVIDLHALAKRQLLALPGEIAQLDAATERRCNFDNCITIKHRLRSVVNADRDIAQLLETMADLVTRLNSSLGGVSPGTVTPKLRSGASASATNPADHVSDFSPFGEGGA
jgi:hypothetical protein